MENEKNKNGKKSGRAKGSKNILTKEMKQLLFNTFKPDYEKLNKLLNSCSLDERAIQLKHFAKYLANGNDEIAEEMRKILWGQLQEHYKKLRFYIPHLTPKEKITVLRGFLSDLTPHDRKRAIDDIDQQNIGL